MDRIAVFPGSFDPFTIGHEHIARRALLVCGKLVVAIGTNMGKQPMYSAHLRLQRVAAVFYGEKRIEAAIYDGLTIDFCRKIGASIIVRGIRTIADCEQEILIAQANQRLCPDIETIFFMAHAVDSGISSSMVRDIIAHGGDAAAFLP